MGRIIASVLSSVMLFVSIVPTVRADSDSAASYAQGTHQIAFIENPRFPDERFVRTSTDVIKDEYLGLEWFVGPRGDTSWDEAKSWVESLTVDGGGWRMPTREELTSLYQNGVRSNQISIVFGTNWRFVWTGEKVGPLHAWGFCFAIGQEFWPRCSYYEGARALAVRSPKTR